MRYMSKKKDDEYWSEKIAANVVFISQEFLKICIYMSDKYEVSGKYLYRYTYLIRCHII